MAFSIFKKETQKSFLVFDVGNGSVGGALVLKNEDGNLKIISSCRADIPTGEQVDFDNLFKSTLQAIDDISPSLTKTALSGTAPVFVILASPWYVSQTKIVSIKNERILTLNRDLRDEIISKEISDFEESLANGNIKTAIGSPIKNKEKNELDIIESQIIHSTLNGYETSKPVDKKAAEAVLSLYLSVSQKNITSGITQKLYTHFPHSKISFHSFPLAYFDAIRDIFPDKNDFLLLDVSGEITDVSLVRKGVLLETVSFPMGRNFILRRVASGLKRTVPEGLSLISMFLSGAIDAETRNKIYRIMSTLKKEWLAEFQKTFCGFIRRALCAG
ncbi:MAG: hypothetical protein WC835_01700 [Candidatus Paceibacterota bacterium]|jgi:hypothetical protein